MKRKSIQTLYFLVLIFCSTHAYAQKDSVRIPSVKIFAEGFISLVTGWESYKGELYSNDWFDSEKYRTTSSDFRYGLSVGKHIFKSVYVFTGISFSSASLSVFNLNRSPDPRYAAIIYDTTYSGYKQKAFHIPILIQLPFVQKEGFLFAFKGGVVNDFVYHDEYSTRFSYSNKMNGTKYINDQHFEKEHSSLTNTRIQLGVEIESGRPQSPVAFLFALTLVTSPVNSKTDREYLLHYKSVFSFCIGAGYKFFRHAGKRTDPSHA